MFGLRRSDESASKPRWRHRLTRGVSVAGATVALVVGGVLAFPAIASAHTPDVVGTASCGTDGTYTVNWTFSTTNVPANATTISYASQAAPSGSTLVYQGQSGAAVELADGSPSTAGDITVHFTQTGIPGSSTQASVFIGSAWSDGYKANTSGMVSLAGSCTPPPPPSKNVTVAAPTVTPATCTAAGSIPASALADGAGYTTSVAPAYSAGKTGSFTITYTALKGYTVNGGPSASFTVNVYPKSAGPGCSVPVTGEVTFSHQAACTNGSTDNILYYDIPTGLQLNNSLTGPLTGKGQLTVTQAMRDAGSTLVFTTSALPGYYTGGSSTLNVDISWWVSLGSTACGINPPQNVTVAAPIAVKPTCSANGSLSTPSNGTGYTVAVSPTYTGPGTYTVTYTGKDGYTVNGKASVSYTETVLPKLTCNTTPPQQGGGTPPTSTTPTPTATPTTAPSTSVKVASAATGLTGKPPVDDTPLVAGGAALAMLLLGGCVALTVRRRMLARNNK